MTNQKTIILTVLVALLLIAGFSIYKSRNNIYSSQVRIISFEECAKAGYPVMESYPRQCKIDSGEVFTENVLSPLPPDKVAAGYVAGHVTIGPNCPGPDRIDNPCITPPEAYSSRSVVVYESDGSTVNLKGTIDANGNYKIALGPGNYFIQISPAGIGPGEKKSVNIKSFETTTINFSIDTGIR